MFGKEKKGRLKKKVKYYTFCARNQPKELRRKMTKRPEIPKQNINRISESKEATFGQSLHFAVEGQKEQVGLPQITHLSVNIY